MEITYTTVADIISASEKIKPFAIKKSIISKTPYGADLRDTDDIELTMDQLIVRSALTEREKLIRIVEKFDTLINLGLRPTSKTYDLTLTIPELSGLTEHAQLAATVDLILTVAK